MDGSRTIEKPALTRQLRGCRLLLACLVALLIAFPFLEDIAHPLILIMALSCVFVAGVVVSESEPHQIRRAIGIAVIQIGFTATSLLLPQPQIGHWIAVALALAATTVLILYSTHCVLRYVLRARVITQDQIYAGVCMYIMLGFAFGAVFYLIDILQPGSFSANTQLRPGDNPDLMYFSFVTLATLGYGDITPRTNIARSLAIVEALVGMLFIAIFMARLVSLRSSNTESD